MIIAIKIRNSISWTKSKKPFWIYIKKLLEKIKLMPTTKYKLISVINDSFQQALGLRYEVLNDSYWNITDTDIRVSPTDI